MKENIKNIVFDLDGTLLPMDTDVFLQSYYKNLKIRLDKYPQYNFEEFMKLCEYGIYSMIKNDGTYTNEKTFWRLILTKFEATDEIQQIFNEFYDNEYKNMKFDMGYQKLAKEVLEILKNKGYRLYCFTSPLFPYKATIERLHWAGIDEKVFLDVTTFEKCSYAKPNIKYYEEALKRNAIDANETLMVGNDVNEDLPIRTLGAKTYLITDCLINIKNTEIQTDYSGSFINFYEFVQKLPDLKNKENS